MIKDRESLVLYTTAVCNLKCRYCYIDKNSALKTIDTILDESFKGDYYFEYAKEVFPDKEQLKEVQIWGGEPTLRLDRCFYTVYRLINYYPNLKRFMFSTNFTTSNWFEQFSGFLNIFKKFPNRKFDFNVQLSIDGPEDLNDSSRGDGVTKEFLKHLDILLNHWSDKIPKNVNFCYFFKPTLDSTSIRLLQDKESVIKYFKFFDSLYSIHEEKCLPKSFRYSTSIPNTACPSPHTKEDGVLFANYCKICLEIENENKNHEILKWYDRIRPFPRRRYTDCHKNGYNCPGGMCGSGKFTVGLLPHRMISVCHNGFVDIIGDYKNKCITENVDSNTSLDPKFFQTIGQESRLTMKYEELSSHELQVESFYKSNAKARIKNIASLINLLARMHQIDTRYINREEALDAAYFIQDSTSYCVRDNINSTGSMTLYPVGLLKLLLNGAREYIEK